MTLRTKFALALLAAALLPMGIAVGVPMLQAGRRAREEGDRRLHEMRRQTGLLIQRSADEAVESVRRVAADLAGDRASRRFLRQGTPAAAVSVARALAARYGLAHLEIRDSGGDRLASWPMAIDDRGFDAVAPIGAGAALLLAPPSSPLDSTTPLAYFARHRMAAPDEVLDVLGSRGVGEAFIAGLSELSGEPASLIDPSGRVVSAAGASPFAERRIEAAVPIGHEGWTVRISVPAGDPWRIRRALLTTLAGVAPFAVVSALILGALLAEGISRPIRALAVRVDSLAATRAVGPLSLVQASDEVRRLTLSFDQMVEALAQSERQRSAAEQVAAWQDVARRIAHEVKNPLSPIKMAVENLRRTREKAPGEFDRALREETETILEEVESLRRLVDEFSEFARLPGPQPAACDIGAVVSQSLALYAPRIDAEKVKLTVDTLEAPASIHADADQIGRVIKNIVVNALDALSALEPAAERRLDVTARAIDGARGERPVRFVEIALRDSGVGFSPGALRRVFEPYFTTRKARGGSGLGMAIAYRIITDHGGTILAGETPGRGATITVRLPVDGPPAT